MTKVLLALYFAAAAALNLKFDDDKAKNDVKVEFDEQVRALQPTTLAIEGKPLVQHLRSDEGMAYYGRMFVGGQEQVSIYDTGSFDLVVESRCLASQKDEKIEIKVQAKEGEKGSVVIPACCNATKCPHASYNPVVSGENFVAPEEPQIEQITYGSGPVLVKSGLDHVSLRDETDAVFSKTQGTNIEQHKVPVKIIVDHEIDLFKETQMTAIVGVGPGRFQEREKRFVNHMGVKRFMVCFQESLKANGLWTWNDRDRSQDPDWLTVPVAGKQFWAMQTSSFKLSGETMGCEPSCGGIIDTGTSLITPPAEVVKAITKKIESAEVEDCSDLSKFPDFEFKLGNHTFSLPPTTYLADAGPQIIEVFHQHLAFRALPMHKRDLMQVRKAKEAGKDAPPVHACVLLLSPGDASEQTQFGPMVIFGMSLFRKYAVQFDRSGDMEGNEGQRKLHLTEAAHDCSGPVKGGEFRRKSVLQKVNLDKLRVSPLQQRFSRKPAKKFGNNLIRKGTFRI